MLKEVMEARDCDKDTAKKCVLSVLNGSKINIPVSWWSNLKTEFKLIANFLASRKEYDIFYKMAKTNKEENIEASTMNMVVCYFENKCLQVLYKFLQSQKIINGKLCCLMFDGLQVPDTPQNRAALTCDLLQKASCKILNKTGLMLQIEIKEFDEALELPEGYESTFEDTFVIESGDDMAAAAFVISKYKDMIKKCNGRVFVNCDGIWIHHDKDVYNTLFKLVSKLDIRKEGIKNTFVYSRNKKSIKDCVDCILADDSYTDDTFADKLFMSNLYYIAFNNGIWSFKDKKLYEYSELPDVYFTKKIHRDFNVGDKKYC
jgi:Zn-finger protein